MMLKHIRLKHKYLHLLIYSLSGYFRRGVNFALFSQTVRVFFGFLQHCGLHYRHSTQNAQLMERSRSMHTTTNNFMQLIPQYLFS
jgi:hypothetical protein